MQPVLEVVPYAQRGPASSRQSAKGSLRPCICPFFHRPSSWPHTHHVHVVEAGGEEERRTLAFRDYLREHAASAREYEALKRRLASAYGAREFSSRQAYADAKGGFIARIVARALASGYLRDL
jgi:GrpB-like predicted nucleotidyltransferase (UPF0157 family)